MKNVLKIFVATAVMGVLTVSAFAQGAGPTAGGKGGPQAGAKGKGPGGGRRGMLQMDSEILAKLKLTPDQDKKVKALKAETQKKAEALRKSLGAGKGGAKAGAGAPPAGGPGGRPQISPEVREKMKAINEGYVAGLKKILTPNQFATYEKEVKAMRDKMKAQFGNRAGGPGAAAGKGKGNKKGGTPPPQA